MERKLKPAMRGGIGDVEVFCGRDINVTDIVIKKGSNSECIIGFTERYPFLCYLSISHLTN
jgi:hypothetical protein